MASIPILMLIVAILIVAILFLPGSWWLWIIGWLALLLLIFVGAAVGIYERKDKPQRHAQGYGRRSRIGSVLKSPLCFHLLAGEVISSNFAHSELNSLSVAGLGFVLLILLLIAIALLFLLWRSKSRT